MSIVEAIFLGVCVLLAFAIGLPQFLRVVFGAATKNVAVSSAKPIGVPDVQDWEANLIKDKLAEKRQKEASDKLLKELAEVAKV